MQPRPLGAFGQVFGPRSVADYSRNVRVARWTKRDLRPDLEARCDLRSLVVRVHGDDKSRRRPDRGGIALLALFDQLDRVRTSRHVASDGVCDSSRDISLCVSDKTPTNSRAGSFSRGRTSRDLYASILAANHLPAYSDNADTQSACGLPCTHG